MMHNLPTIADQNSNEENAFLKLPLEILMQFLSYLNAEQLRLQAFVCRDFNIISSSDVLWKSICLSASPTTLFNAQKDFKALYRERFSDFQIMNLIKRFSEEYAQLPTIKEEEKDFLKILNFLRDNISTVKNNSTLAKIFVGLLSLELDRVVAINPDAMNEKAGIINSILYDNILKPLEIGQIEATQVFVTHMESIAHEKFAESGLNKVEIMAGINNVLTQQNTRFQRDQFAEQYANYY